jgi:excinuclease ABC subunit A
MVTAYEVHEPAGRSRRPPAQPEERRASRSRGTGSSCITGPSGSGKSSLAFDTIYAEGQRRYVESLAPTRGSSSSSSPSRTSTPSRGSRRPSRSSSALLSKSPRSTVGTVTEIADYLRLLFARVGTPHCPSCGKRIEAQTVQQIVDSILGDGRRRARDPPRAHRARPQGRAALELERLRREGFVRARIDGELVDLGDEIVLDGKPPHDLDVVIDRLVVKDGLKGRVTDSVELALKLGEGRLLVDRRRGDEPRTG